MYLRSYLWAQILIDSWHQLTRVTLIIWDCRGLLPNSFKREMWKTERDVASPFAMHGTDTQRFVEVYFYITGIILYIFRPFLTDPFVSFSWKLCQFLVSRFDGSCWLTVTVFSRGTVGETYFKIEQDTLYINTPVIWWHYGMRFNDLCRNLCKITILYLRSVSLVFFLLSPRILQSVRRHSAIVLTVSVNGVQQIYPVIYLLLKLNHNWLIMVTGDFTEY